MPVRFDDDDALTKVNSRFARHPSPRADIWRWLYLWVVAGKRLARETCNGSSMRDAIAAALESKQDLVDQLLWRADKYMLPDSKLAWITSDERQLHWLLPRVNKLTEKTLPHGLIHLTGRDEIIAMIDVWQAKLWEKDQRIEQLRSDWTKQRIRDSEFDWFADKKEGEKRRDCAKDWLKASHLWAEAEQMPIDNHSDLLMFFATHAANQFERQEIIRHIKNRWHRAQFDARNAEKKQLNVMISKSAISQLDTLGKQHNLRRAQIIEQLIVKEAEMNAYLQVIAKE